MRTASKYYEILFMYVDDILAVSHKATDVIKEIMAFLQGEGREYKAAGYISWCKYNEGKNDGQS